MQILNLKLLKYVACYHYKYLLLKIYDQQILPIKLYFLLTKVNSYEVLGQQKYLKIHNTYVSCVTS